jgi:protein arginine kinase activator
MKCEDCHKREAEVKVTQIVNNQKTTLNLCKECANARGHNSPFQNVQQHVDEMIGGEGWGAQALNSQTKKQVPDIRCPKCSMSFEQFLKKARFGCGECYRAFRSELEQAMRGIHGASLHRGKSPVHDVSEEADKDSNKVIPVKEEERLEAELKKAVEAEDFERAAEIRDKLKMIRSGNPVDK